MGLLKVMTFTAAGSSNLNPIRIVFDQSEEISKQKIGSQHGSTLDHRTVTVRSKYVF